ncbi:hypothetical protein ABZ023_10340 [Streptomyces sp. NPDC006367]|uniref:hypothetical protein n=1 Tax=unclassified Streptomyces TaxID=2593676 RepID=UPI0033BB826A
MWLSADAVENDETRRRLGEARSDRELLDRAVAAYAASLERDHDDRLLQPHPGEGHRGA